jgi:hypothetical protein
VPTSVLLAVLAAAGLLALAPALVRRYDATERLAAERALSTARVIDRQRRRRTVPGRRPVNPPRMFLALAAPALTLEGVAPVSAVPVSAAPVSPPAAPAAHRPPRRSAKRRRSVRRHTPAIYRRRRVLLALVLLNISELCGVGLLGPGFWIGSVPSLVLLGAYLVHLRNRALLERRRRRVAARLAAREALLRRVAAVRAAERREVLRRAAAARATAQRESVRLSQRYVARGRSYESRASGY